jgi:dipeptidase D
MSSEVRQLAPGVLWNHFSDLNEVPRPSKKEERVIEFMKNFGESLGLDTMVDEVGNVIVKKPATKGMEGRHTVVMQSHIDMVHQKNNDTDFDFDQQGIDMFIEKDWVKARGTTLGADNGIGVAAIMAVLSSNDIAHPAIEALFTIDEETGMTGAMGLKGGLLEGGIMLNLDTEDDEELTIGCAGGVDVTATGNYDSIQIDGSYLGKKITVKGLQGGHSGMEIHKGLGNSNKLMNRILWNLNTQCDYSISSIDGGGLRNAIPRESNCVLSLKSLDGEKFEAIVKKIENELQLEYRITDVNLAVEIEDVDSPSNGMNKDFQSKFLSAIYSCPVGIYRMSPDMKDLVQSSNNLARVVVGNGEYTVMCLTRGSVDSEKIDLANSIKACFLLIGANVEFSGSYPGWEPKPDSPVISMMNDLYLELHGSKAHVSACHAGLECGILGTNYPEMQMISFGPNIRGAHSPDEKVQITSVQKFWNYLLEALKRIPEA